MFVSVCTCFYFGMYMFSIERDVPFSYRTSEDECENNLSRHCFVRNTNTRLVYM